MKTQSVILLLYVILIHGTIASKILFFSFPTFSHYKSSFDLAVHLAPRGHEVWLALPTQLANDKRLQAKGVNILKYDSIDHINMEVMMDEHLPWNFDDSTTLSRFEKFKSLCDEILHDSVLFEGIKRISFDLFVLDATPLPRMLTIIPYRLNVPFVFFGSGFEPQASRSPIVVSSHPALILPASPIMSFGQRVLNTLLHSIFILRDPFSYYSAVATYAPEMPYVTMEALTAKGLLWLIEQEPLLDYPVALLPNVKYVGSLSAWNNQSLPDEYKAFMDEAKEGVVVVSFGSQVKSLPEDIANRLLDAFSQTKYRYVFRSYSTISRSPNIKITKWMPQTALLSHPNTKLFITHCGAKGQNEGFVKGVPMIGFPLFAEQPHNAMKLEYHGFGVKMDLKTFEVSELISNINEIIQNKSFSQKIKKASEISKLRPRSPIDESIYWIEHVIQYGGEHLRSYCQDMPLYQFLNLDVIGLLVFILHLSVFIMWKLCCCCFRRCCRQERIPKAKKE